MENVFSQKTKKLWFWISIFANLGFLGIFKYYNFFVDSFVSVFNSFGIALNPWTLNIILPVGISFYTFHGLSYVIDIYKGKIKAEKNFVNYAVFVSFFPLLVAGPIERATHLLPQIKKERFFDYKKAIDGLRQILWGLFKKIVIADVCAVHVNHIFANSANYNGVILVFGAFLFAFQIYGDFSGYSDIALGTARLFGIELLKNFSFPYFSRDIAEFWRRWHISLSSWFKDYLYVPLGGSRVGILKKIRNTFFIFLVSGFWHGANWTFIFWGLLNALYFLPLLLMNRNRNYLNVVAQNKFFPSSKELTQMLVTFSLTSFAWIFFRSQNLKEAFQYIQNMYLGLTEKNDYLVFYNYVIWEVGFVFALFLVLFIIIEWESRNNNYGLEKTALSWHPYLRFGFYQIILLIIIFSFQKEQTFIYFQF
jgi:alginate O-acetyltransferase complex protein AlgI